MAKILIAEVENQPVAALILFHFKRQRALHVWHVH
jgi:hypothetical protein